MPRTLCIACCSGAAGSSSSEGSWQHKFGMGRAFDDNCTTLRLATRLQEGGAVVVLANELEYFGDQSTGNIKR